MLYYYYINKIIKILLTVTVNIFKISIVVFFFFFFLRTTTVMEGAERISLGAAKKKQTN